MLRRFWPERLGGVTHVGFEYSPRRGSAAYTTDRSAFDVYVEHTTPGGGRLPAELAGNRMYTAPDEYA